MDYPPVSVSNYDHGHPNERLNLPMFLYYIQHARSQTKVSGKYGDIEAADTTQSSYTLAELKQRTAEHLAWRNKRPSCFVSAFAELYHALNWGRQLEGPVYMYKIDTRLFARDPFKHYVSPVQVLGQDQYLFLHRIPRVAIVSCQQIKAAGCGKCFPVLTSFLYLTT